MAFTKRLIAVASTSAIVAGTAAGLAAPAFADDKAGVDVAWKVVDSWSTGQQVEIVVKNNGSSTIQNWALDLATTGPVTSGWNATFAPTAGKVGLSGPSWDRNLAPGQTLTLGAITGPNAQATKCIAAFTCTVNGQASVVDEKPVTPPVEEEVTPPVEEEIAPPVEEVVTPPAPSTNLSANVKLDVASEWGSGRTVNVTLTNTSSQPINGWELQLPWANDVTAWNADSSYKGGVLHFKNVSWNGSLAPGASTTIGFSESSAKFTAPTKCAVVTTAGGAACTLVAPTPDNQTPAPPVVDPEVTPPVEDPVVTEPTDGVVDYAPNNSIAKRALIGYWQNWGGANSMRISQISDDYDVIIVSFADAVPTKPGAVTFNLDNSIAGGYTEAQFKADVAAKRAKGKQVLLSIGGETGNVDFSGAQSVDNFGTSMSGVIKQYGFDGFDIDLEHGMNVENIAQATELVRSKVGDQMVLTMAPQTIDVQPGGTYEKLIKRLNNKVDIVHTQYYNSGSMFGRDGKIYEKGDVDFITAQADILLGYLQPHQVALGLPATANAAGSGYVSPATVNKAYNCLTVGTDCGTYKPVKKYQDLRGVMTWSINLDAKAGNAFSAPVRKGLNS